MIHGHMVPEIRETNIRKKTGMVWRNLYKVGDALEKYKVDNGRYPGKSLMNLTTPVAYLETLPLDPSSKKDNGFIYISDKGNWIV